MEVALVVPCFNEAGRWDAIYWTNLLSLDSIKWIFVDDGSTDNTQALITEAISGTRHTLLVQGVNRGKAEAIRTGLTDALNHPTHLPAIIGFMDADGAFDREDIRRILQQAFLAFDRMTVDAVWSARVALAGRNIERSARRHYLGRIAATLLSWNNPSIPYDTQCGFKVFAPTEAFRKILETPFMTRWLFEVEMLTRFHGNEGRPMRIWEEPLQHWRDVPGSKISAREVLRIGREIITVKRGARTIT